jgi:hypothetical protein
MLPRMGGSVSVDSLAFGGQRYVERPPVRALTGLVSSMWIQQVAPDAAPYTQRNIPNGGVELLCPVGSAPRVVGPLTRPLMEVLTPGTTIVGVRLRPGAPPSVRPRLRRRCARGRCPDRACRRVARPPGAGMMRGLFKRRSAPDRTVLRGPVATMP